MFKRLWKHLVSILGSTVLTILGNVLVVPIYLLHWTPVVYGEWLVVSSVANYLSTLDFGMNSAVGNRMLASFTRNDLDDYRRCQHSAMAFFVSLAVAGTLLVGILVAFFPVSHWIGLKVTSPREAAWVIWLLSLQVLWAMPAGMVGNTYRAIGEPSRTQWLNNIRMLLSILVVITVLLTHGNMLELAIVQTLPTVLITLYVLASLRLRHPSLMPGLSQASVEIVRQIMKPSSFFAVIMIGMAIYMQGTVLLVSSLLGGAMVAIFVTTRTLSNVVMQVVGIIKNAAWPDLTILFAEGNTVRLQKVVRMLLTASVTICIGMACALFFEGQEVVTVWTRHRLHVDQLFLGLFLLYLVLQSPWVACSGLMLAINRHQNLSWSYLGSSVLGLLIAIFLVPHWGLAAVPLSLIFAEAIACYHFVIKETCLLIEEPYLPFAVRLWGRLFLTLGCALGFGWVAHQLSWGPAIFRWVEVGAVTMGAASLTAWAACLEPYERSFFVAHLQSLLAKGNRISNIPA